VDASAVDGIPELVRQLTGTGGPRFDRVFNILHGQRGGGEDGVVQGLLEALGVPYTGSGVLGSALSMDKVRTKQVWLALGLPTPAYVSLERGDDVTAAAHKLGLPVIVKPACEGSSVGVTRCFKDADLDAAVDLAARYPGDMLVEQLVQGDEFTVAVLGVESLPSIRIVPAGEYYDYHAKYVAEDTQYLCPGASGATEQELGSLALAAFFAAGCSGWGRVDFMRDRAGKAWLLEVNTAPGMTSHSLVPKAARTRGIEFDDLVWRVLETSFAVRRS
jgi:D-alanine-D-alanine ligase